MHAFSYAVPFPEFMDTKERIILTCIQYIVEGAATAVSVGCCGDVLTEGLQSGTSVLDRCLICIYGWVWPRYCGCPTASPRIRTLNARLWDFRCSFQIIRSWYDILSQCSTADWKRLLLLVSLYFRERSHGTLKQQNCALTGALTLSLPLILSSFFLVKMDRNFLHTIMASVYRNVHSLAQYLKSRFSLTL